MTLAGSVIIMMMKLAYIFSSVTLLKLTFYGARHSNNLMILRIVFTKLLNSSNNVVMACVWR